MPEAVSRLVHPRRRRTLLLLARMRGGGRQDGPHPCRTLESEEIAGAEKKSSALLAFPRGHDLADAVADLDKSGHKARRRECRRAFLFCPTPAHRRLLRCAPCRHMRE